MYQRAQMGSKVSLIRDTQNYEININFSHAEYISYRPIRNIIHEDNGRLRNRTKKANLN